MSKKKSSSKSSAKPVAPSRTGSRSYDQFKQKKYEAALKDWEKEQAKQGIVNKAAVVKAQKEARKATERAAELTSISSLEVSDALQYQSKSSSKKFKFENVLDDIKVNANNIYEQRRAQDLPDRIGSRSRAGGFSELRERIKTISEEAGIDYREFYDRTKLTGGTIGKDQKFRLKVGSEDDFEVVDTSNDVYGIKSIKELSNDYKQKPANLTTKAENALAIINRAPQAMGAQIAASNVKAKIPKYKSAYESIGL